MKRDWERRPPVAIDRGALSDLLAPVFPGRTLESAEGLSGGLANTNVKVRLSGLDESFVVRLSVRDLLAGQREAALHQLVSPAVPVPEVLHVSQDGTAARPFAVMTWVDGVPLSRLLEDGDPDVAGAARSAGEALAAIGRHRFAQPGFFGPHLAIETPLDIAPRAYIEFVQRALFEGAGAAWLGAEVAARLMQFVEANASYMAGVQGESVLVHADFNPENILVQRRGERWLTAAVLDWEFAFSATPLFDIGNMLRYRAEMPAEFEQEFVRGYLEGGGRLPRDWKRISKLLDLLSLCQFLSPPDQGEAVVRDMRRLIQAILDSWDSLAA